MMGLIRGCPPLPQRRMLLALPSSAIAGHRADQHSPNMQLNAFLFKPGDLTPPPEGTALASANSDFAFWGNRLV